MHAFDIAPAGCSLVDVSERLGASVMRLAGHRVKDHDDNVAVFGTMREAQRPESDEVMLQE